MSGSSLVYISRGRIGEGRFRDAALRAILDISNQRNAAVGITGVLLHGDGEFMQLLEGPHDAVEHCYARILRDRRHEDVQLVAVNTMASRLFAEWNMAYIGLEEVRSIAGEVALHQLRRGGSGAAEALGAMLKMARAQLS